MKKMAATMVNLFFSLLFLTSKTNSQAPVISFQSVLTGLSNPVDVINPGDGSNRLFIVEQGGTIKVWDGITLTPFMNLGAGGAGIITSGGERGLLSMAFHPGFNGTTNR